MQVKLLQLAAVLCIALAFSFTVRAAGAGKQVNLPVTSSIVDTDTTGAAFQIQEDDLGSYANTKSVQSVIQPIGDWVLDTNSSSLSTRGVYLDFSRNVDPIVTAPWTGPIGVKARLITQCPTYGYSMLPLKTGVSVGCGLVIGFDYGGSQYRLAMNPGGPSGYTDTDVISVACAGADTAGQCNQWTIADAGGGSVAKLLVSTTVNHKSVWVDKGNYYFSFSITVSNP
jgi:hypothetical protein